MRKINFRLLLATTTLAVVASGALAHGDEDHSQDGKKSSATAVTTGAAVAVSNFASPQRLADGSLFVPKPVQRQLGIRTLAVRIGDLAATVELNGKVIADPDSSGRVQATFSGSAQGKPGLGKRV